MTALEARVVVPRAREGQRVLSGPVRNRSENCWQIELADGSRAVLAQLLPELARDEALRRRYVFDVERRLALAVSGVARILELGPQPDPRDPAAAPPWRLREDPVGERLSAILEARAPLPVDEAIELVAELGEVTGAVHRAGVVLRDLEPRNIIARPAGSPGPRLTLTDIGLARVDILSTRTASSLMLEGSAYAAPEHLRATVLDLRADIYTLGVILWEALTGEVPFAETGAFFRDRARLPSLASLGIDAPPGLDALIEACLADDPEKRPESARDFAEALRPDREDGEDGERGERGPTPSHALARIVCQACGAALRPGLRLCLSCGKQAVQFEHAGAGQDPYDVQLVQAREDAEFVAKLRAFFAAIGEGPVPELNFLIGDTRLYSRAERERLHKLPATLIGNLSQATADRLAARLKDDGFKVKVVRSIQGAPAKKRARPLVYGGLVGGLAGVVSLAGGAVLLGVPLLLGGATLFTVGLVRGARARRRRSPALAGLRHAPAALPASDPLIARLGALLGDDLAADVRERLEEVALLVQRLVDHRAREAGGAIAADFERLTEPVAPMVTLIETEARAIRECDAALADLDEGKLVRAIAGSEARGEPRNVRVELYAGLDRLRSLEDQRAHHMERLLEASSLMRRAVTLGLRSRSESAETDRLISMATAALES